MANYTGKDMTSSMIAFYVQTINEAYTYYNTDLEKSTEYIINRLEGTYSGYFSVFIMT